MREADYIAGNPELAGSASLIIISGCSGGGKSSLIDALAERGFAVRHEAGRQIVKEQLLIGGDGLPWDKLHRFVDLTVSRAAHQFNTVRPDEGPVFFDRSIVDVATYTARIGHETPPHLQAMLEHYRYHSTVLMIPPWEEIFQTDAERRHGFEEAVEEYEALLTAYKDLGYETRIVPKAPIPERIVFILSAIDGVSPRQAGSTRSKP